MVSPNVNKVWQETKSLSAEERRELLVLLNMAQAEAWRPLPVQGKPLSETIIEERR